MKTTPEKHSAWGGLIRQWNGPLTRDLVLRPGEFGLGVVPARLKPDATTVSVCGFCSTGCGLNIHLKEGAAVNLSAAADYPVNLGTACPKGWEALSPLDAPDRATIPLLRNADGAMQPVEWAEALRVFSGRFKSIQGRYGNESVAWLGTGQIVTEEMAILGALGKFGMGMVHGDGNTRQCMATAVTAYKESFGFDAPPFTYADFEESDVLVFIGSNLCVAHPILWHRVLRNPHQPEIIVVDPRKTETAMAATQHYALEPKSDLVLLYGLAHLLIKTGAVNHPYIAAHTTGFEEFAQFLESFTPEAVCKRTGLSLESLHHFARTIAEGKRVSFWWTMGVNQGHEATRTAQAIINLALMTGNIGRPGTGANSITGQCNAMGSRLYSNTTSLFGGRSFGNPDHRAEVARILDIDEARIPQRDSLAYDQIIQGIDEGRIKGLWMVATNAAHSWINQSNLIAAFKKLEFLVVQDMYSTTETAQMAHLVLPAAGWGEKEGTFINSERRIGIVKKVRRAPGQALSDFSIFKLVAEAWGCGDLLRRWSNPEATFQLLKELSRGRPCDITGIQDYQMLDRQGGVQWPWPESGAPGGEPAALTPQTPPQQRRLFADGGFFHADGKARFIFCPPRELPEPTDAEYPWTLLTGRGTSAQWHTLTRTGKSDVLRKLSPSAVYVEINPLDAEKLGITANSEVSVVSRRGRVTAAAMLTPTLKQGQLFMPMHFASVNQLTFPAVDPHSRQPSYKACAVRLERV